MHDLIWHLLMLAFWGTGFMAGVLWEKRMGRAYIDDIIEGHISKAINCKLSDNENKAVINSLLAYKKAYYE